MGIAGIIIDVVIVLFMMLAIFIGYKRGLIKVTFGLLSFALALIISLILYKPVSHFITNYTPIPEKIETHIERRIYTGDEDVTDNFISNYYSNIKNSSASLIAYNVTNTIINISSILIVFLLSKIILLFLRFSTDLIAKLPLIKQFNHIGGFIYGILLGFILIYIFMTVITLLAPILDLNNILEIINSSIIGNIMYNNNIIFMLLK